MDYTNGHAFVDPKQRSPLINVASLLRENDIERTCDGFQSLFDEADIMRELQDPTDTEHPFVCRYREVIRTRESTLPLAAQISVKGLAE